MTLLLNREAIEDLIARCESATGGSRDLDARLWCAFVQPQVYKPEKTWIDAPSGRIIRRSWNVPAYTTSLDAAVALVDKMLPDSAPEIFSNALDAVSRDNSRGAEFSSALARKILSAMLESLAQSPAKAGKG